MVQYIYFVKCPNCEDEPFDFFDEAKDFALGCMSKKPIITQIEVCRNDFGECTDSNDLGTVWSWEDMMTDTEPTKSVFTKDDLKPWMNEDPEFAALDNSVDFEPEIPEVSAIDAVPDSFRRPISEATRINPIDSTEATDRKLIELVDNSLAGPITDRIGSSGFYSENGQRFMVIPVSAGSDSYDFDSYKNDLKQVFPNTDIYCMIDDSEIIVDVTSFYPERKPIPADMTIESLVEEMEENEDMVECKVCNDLYPKEDCHYETDMGYLCPTCEKGIKSRGETLTFKEGKYQDFLDEERTLTDIVKDSINHLINDLGKDPWADDFTDDVTIDIENNYDIYVPEDIEQYNRWCSAVACEVSRQVNNSDTLTEANLSDIAAAANNEFDNDWNSEDLLDMAGVEDDFRLADVQTELTPSEKAKADWDAYKERSYKNKLAAWRHYKKTKGQ